jgi:hypothetical protein
MKWPKNIFVKVTIADSLAGNVGRRFRFGLHFKFPDAETEPTGMTVDLLVAA